MHAHASAPYATPASHRRQLSPKAVERRQNRLHYRAQLATFLEELAVADLTGTSYRVILDTVSRMLRRGSCTEAVGNEWVAQRLGVGRNAVSSAYAALEAAGFVRRVAVKHRGAPTRTRLINVAATLVDGAIPAQLTQLPEQGATAPSHAPRAPVARSAAVQACPEPAPASQAGRAEVPPTEAKPPKTPEPTAPKFIFSQAVYDAMVAKVPLDRRMHAMNARSPKECPVDPAWSLTADETAHYLALVPKPEPVRTKPTPTAESQRVAVPQDAEMMRALAYAHERLSKITGSPAKAAELGDQIAFQVTQGLGGGDIMGGVRAGISLVGKGRWKEPHTYRWFKSKWSGLTARAYMNAALG